MVRRIYFAPMSQAPAGPHLLSPLVLPIVDLWRSVPAMGIKREDKCEISI